MDRPFDKNKRADDQDFMNRLHAGDKKLNPVFTDKQIIINPKKDTTPLQKLMKYFKIGINKDRDNAPLEDKIRPLNDDGQPEHFNDLTKKYYKYYLQQTQDDIETFKNMAQVWQDQDMLYYNSPIAAKSVNVIVDEIVQADLNFKCIGIEAKEKQRKFIENLFDTVNIYNITPSIAHSTILYGNTGTIILESEKDPTKVQSLLPIDIYDFKKVYAFTAFEVKQRMEKKDKFFMDFSTRDRVDKLISSILNEDNYSSYFKEYILGYQVGDFVIPPWKFLHFKNRTVKSPFRPFGSPHYMHMVGPYRQFDSGMTLQNIARSARIPIDVYSINAPNTVDPISKINVVTEFIRAFQNSSIATTKKEEKGIGEILFTVKDLFEYTQITPNIDIGKIDDLEMLRDEIMIASDLPRYLLDEKDSGFGSSGITLVQQSKPFARTVYKYQSVLLENFTQFVKIAMMMSNEFSQDEMDFMLTMPYPESQISTEVVNNQKDLIDLSNNILDTLSNRLLGDSSLPDDLVRAVFHQIMPYDQKRIDSWIQMIQDKKEKDKIEQNKTSNPEDNYNMFDAYDEKNRTIYYQKHLSRLAESGTIRDKSGEKITVKRLSEQINDAIFEERHKLVREGVMQNKHFFSSKNEYSDFNARMLREWQIQDVDNKDHDYNAIRLKEDKTILPYKMDTNRE